MLNRVTCVTVYTYILNMCFYNHLNKYFTIISKMLINAKK